MATVTYEKKGNIGYVTINRPEVMNALSAEAWQDMTQALINVRDDAEVRAAILTGAGDKAFSVGADLKAPASARGAVKGLSPLDLFTHLGVWTPVIAAINGYCMGDGFFLALACDIRIAVEDAVFGMPEVGLGISPDRGVTQWLPRLIGGSAALRLTITGERFSAADAYRFGLVSEVVPKAGLMAAAEKVAKQVCANGPLAVRGAKRAIWTGMRRGMDEGLELEEELYQAAMRSLDYQEAMQAFREKRKPNFLGR